MFSSEPWRNLSQLLQIYSCSRFIAAKPQGAQALRARRKVLCSCHLCRGAREIPPSPELQGILGSHVAVVLFYDGEGIQSSGRNRQAGPGPSDFVAAMSERHPSRCSLLLRAALAIPPAPGAVRRELPGAKETGESSSQPSSASCLVCQQVS